MYTLIKQIKKNRSNRMTRYIGDVFHNEYYIKNKNIIYYYNGDDMFLFHLDKDTAWVNLKITYKMCDFNLIEKSPIGFLKGLLCEKFKLDIKYIYSVG